MQHRYLRRVLPIISTPWGCIAVISAALILLLTAEPITDIDSYWHVLMGQDIWRHHRLTGNPTWSLHADPRWRTTQWASEMLLAGLHALFSWSGMAVFRVLAAAACLTTCTRYILADRTNLRARVIVFALVMLAFTTDLQDRPESLSFALIPLLGEWARRAISDRQLPAWWKVAILTALWANFHGYWLLVPLMFGSLATAHALSARSLANGRPALLRALLAAACALITPTTWHIYQSMFAIQRAASLFITEWKPTSLHIGAPLAGLALAFVLATAWARAEATTRPPMSEIVFVTGWALFGVLAYRNVLPAMLITSPVVAARLAAVLPRAADKPTRLMRGISLTIATVALVATPTLIATTNRQPPFTPTRLYTDIAHEPGPRRVLNYYNLAGQTLAFTRPGISVYIDGRTDYYGRDYMTNYVKLINAAPGWQALLRNAHPTDVLMPSKEPLCAALTTAGWRVIDRQHHYLLLAPPTAR